MTVTRGKSKTLYDPINGILFGQWKNKKVVSFISSLPLIGNGTTIQQCESEKVPFLVGNAVDMSLTCLNVGQML